MTKYVENEAMKKALEEIEEAVRQGELINACFRLYLKDGTFRDIVIGAKSDEERQALLEDLDMRIKSGSN